MPRLPDLVSIARVVRPQGRRGEILIEPLSDRPERFSGLARVFVRGPGGEARQVRVTSCWPHRGRFVLKLEGVDSIDDAERYRGLELGISEAELPPLPPGSYYHHQLLGLAVEDSAGATLGRVVEVMETGAGAKVLVVRGAAEELLIPFAEGFIKRVEVAAGRLVAERPEYADAD